MDDPSSVDMLSRLETAFQRYRVTLEIELRLLGLVPVEMAQELRSATDAAKRAWQAVEKATTERREAALQNSGLKDLDRAQRHGAARA
jgi:hypothetical protein